MITTEEKLLIDRLKKLDSEAKKAPWYPQGAKVKDKAIYKVGPAEEALICALRNSIGDLIKIIERQEKQLA